MADRYIVFDVETPNLNNDRMSSIGICVVEDKKIVKEYSTLINPETYFAKFNIQLTGITPAMVADAPTFPEFWMMMEPVFSSGILVAHNASFDVRVLSYCLNAYGITWVPKAKYCCTVSMGRKVYPGLPNHKLDTLCRHLNIPLNHHQALSDCEACAKLLIDYMEHGLDPHKCVRRRDMTM